MGSNRTKRSRFLERPIAGLLRFANVLRLSRSMNSAPILRARNQSPIPELEAESRGDAAIDSLDLSQHELRSRRTPWVTPPARRPPSIKGGFRCEVLVVGAGITGALVAERLTREGREVVLVDRERPGEGSTLASTAMLLWEIDHSLGELTELYGFERATRGYRVSLSAVRGLKRLVAQLQLKCRMRERQAIYLAAGDGAESLRKEAELRSRAGLPGLFLDHRALKSRFGFERPGAILSPDAADADPVALTHNLLDIVLGRGARLFKGEAVAFDASPMSVVVGFDQGAEVEAKSVVLATGYAMPPIVQATIQQPSSTWAIATAPQPLQLWPEEVLVWEATRNYHYGRTTADGRIVFGGEDDQELIEPKLRDEATPSRTRRLEKKLKSLWPGASPDIDCRWSGTFDSTRDGLPLIGAVGGAGHIYAAYGYGGNGITFSYLAAALIARRIAGGTSPLFDDFAIERDAP
jgi:glycine/D-amino acid oxidase-like deaminating enzyme